MTDHDDFLAELRPRAEEQVEGLSITYSDKSRDEIIHELKVYQIELEMQNQQLRETQIRLQKALESFTTLYHKSPVGFVTIDENAVIIDLNQAVAGMCQQAIQNMRNRYLWDYLTESSAAELRQRLPAFFRRPEGKIYRINFRAADGREVATEMQGYLLPVQHGGAWLACNIVDISHRHFR